MTRTQLIKKVKEHFNLSELVCPHVYQRDGEKAWRYFPSAFLETLAAIRDIVAQPMIANTWENGGEYSQRGCRCNLCALVSANTAAKVLYVSAHSLFQALDFHCSGTPAEDVRALIIKNADKLPHPIRLEDGVSWVHFDVYHTDDKSKVTKFNA